MISERSLSQQYYNGNNTHSDKLSNRAQYSHLTDEHLKHLLGRGFTVATIEAAGLYSASAEQVAELLGYNPKSGGIVIPFFHPLTGEIVLNRVRPDKPPIFNGKPAKYLSPKRDGTSTRAGNRLYFPPGAQEWIGDPTIPIGFTEGEFKAL